MKDGGNVDKVARATKETFEGDDLTMKQALLIANEVNEGVKAQDIYNQDMKGENADKWRKACDEELASIEELNVYTLVDTPNNRK